MAEKWMRSTSYRGFFIEVVKRDDTGISVYWNSVDGDVRRWAVEQPSANDAVEYAKGRIDEYHSSIDRADYPTPGITRRR